MGHKVGSPGSQCKKNSKLCALDASQGIEYTRSMADETDTPEIDPPKNVSEPLRRALGEIIVGGIDTTLPLFEQLVDEPDIQTGSYNIHWLETWLARAED